MYFNYRITSYNVCYTKLLRDNLLTYPEVSRLLKEEKLKVHGWYYDIESGRIDYYDKKEDKFKVLEVSTYE